MTKRSYTEAERTAALEVYVAEGPCEAERRTGVPKGTVTKWAKAAGVVSRANEHRRAAIEAAAESWAERRARLVDKMGEVAEIAVDRARDELEAGSARNARDCTASAAVMADKAQLLSGSPTSRTQVDSTVREEVLADARNRGLSLVPRSA